jgi:hypothetical protein
MQHLVVIDLIIQSYLFQRAVPSNASLSRAQLQSLQDAVKQLNLHQSNDAMSPRRHSLQDEKMMAAYGPGLNRMPQKNERVRFTSKRTVL